GQVQARLAFEIGRELAQKRGVGPEQRVPRLQTAPTRQLPGHDPIEMRGGVRFREYLHMQSPGSKILAPASISITQQEIAKMIKEVEVDPDGSLTRRWGTRAEDVRVSRAMVALEATGMTVVTAPVLATAKLTGLE